MLDRSALAVSVVTLLLLGCSGASAPGDDSREAGTHTDAATDQAAGEARSPIEASGSDASDAHSPGADVAHEAALTEAAPSVDSSAAAAGPCASCTAMMCPTQLEGCAGSEGCTDALVAFNDCFTAPDLGASCGATFASAGSQASAMWACMSTTCKATCG
jgi:hypothetical protein